MVDEVEAAGCWWDVDEVEAKDEEDEEEEEEEEDEDEDDEDDFLFSLTAFAFWAANIRELLLTKIQII